MTKQIIDLAGKKFNKLTAIENTNQTNKQGSFLWKFLCDCGKEKIIPRNSVVSGTIKSCGCGRRRGNLIGKRFGKLLVDEEIKERSKHGHILWKCKCDCGNITSVSTKLLNNQQTKSCGCLEQEMCASKSKHWRGYGEIHAALFTRIKWCARKKNYRFDITKKFIWELFLKQNRKCAISGVDITLPKRIADMKHGLMTASLDRIDSTKGYIKGNVQWVHKDLQRMKWEFNELKFYEWIKIIYQHKFGEIDERD